MERAISEFTKVLMQHGLNQKAAREIAEDRILRATYDAVLAVKAV